MNFTERFKGKTSIMTKEGLPALVKSSKLPVSKRTNSPDFYPSDESPRLGGPIPLMVPFENPQNNTQRYTSFLQKRLPPKYPSVWHAATSNQTNNPILSYQQDRLIVTQNTTPHTTREDNSLPQNFGSNTSEPEFTLPISRLSKQSQNYKYQPYEIPIPSINWTDERKTSRAQSTPRSRLFNNDEHNQRKISPFQRDENLKLIYQQPYIPNYPRQSNGIKTTLFTSGERSISGNMEVQKPNIYAWPENNDAYFQRSSTQQDLSGYEGYLDQKNNLLRYPYRGEIQKEEEMIAHLVEANVVKYLDNIYGPIVQNKNMPQKILPRHSPEPSSDQNTGPDRYDRKRENTSGQVGYLHRQRAGSDSSRRRNQITSAQKKTHTRVTFKTGDIVNKLKNRSENTSTVELGLTGNYSRQEPNREVGRTLSLK